MNRRKAIKKTSLILGMAVSSPVVMSIINGCVPKKTIDWQPKFLTQNQAILVGNIAETILPKTNTPGALDIGIDAFIDHIVDNCYSDQNKEIFLNGLIEVERESDLLDGESFVNLSDKNKVKLLNKFEQKAAQIDIENGKYPQPFFQQIKELTLLGYFTSEEIMKNELEYVPIPTRLEGCIDMKENQKLIVGNQVS